MSETRNYADTVQCAENSKRKISQGEIITRMIDPAPDVTRIIDRLTKEGLAERFASSRDKRLSLSRITEKGRLVLQKVKPEVKALHRLISDKLSNSESKQLSILLEKIYKDMF